MKYWVVLDFLDEDDDGLNSPYYWSDSEYVGYVFHNFSCCSYLHAKAFDTREEAMAIAVKYYHARVEVVNDRIIENGRKHQLRMRGAQLFNLPWNTPKTVMADRYEEEGMIEEATILRH